MRAGELLHNFFNTTCKIDTRIKRTLFGAAESLIAYRNLSINAIGRSLSSTAYMKHCIKRIDRLFSNNSFRIFKKAEGAICLLAYIPLLLPMLDLEIRGLKKFVR